MVFLKKIHKIKIVTILLIAIFLYCTEYKNISAQENIENVINQEIDSSNENIVDQESGENLTQVSAAFPEAGKMRYVFGNELPITPGSLMFSEDELLSIYGIIDPEYSKAYDFGGEADPANLDSIHAPSFYLSAIVYHGAGDWSLWVDGKRVRSKDRYEEEAKIVRTLPDYVEFLWQKPELDLIAPNWRDVLVEYTPDNRYREFETRAPNNISWDYKSADGSILLDDERKLIKFRLHPAQSFVSRTMSVVNYPDSGANVQVSEADKQKFLASFKGNKTSSSEVDDVESDNTSKDALDTEIDEIFQ